MKSVLIACVLAGSIVAPTTTAFAADPARLEALDAALRSGILTKEEYDAKKRALIADGPKVQTEKPRPSGGAPAGPRQYLRMRVARVMDAEGWGEPVEALRLLVPSDWRTEGAVRWVPNVGCPSNIIQLRFRATAPDGITGIEFLPMYTWAASEDPQMQQIIQRNAGSQMGCQPGPAVGAVDFLRGMVVPQVRPGARVVGAESLTAATQVLQRSFAPMNQQFAASGLETMRTGDEIGRAHV